MELQSRLHKGDRVRIRPEVDPGLYNGLSTMYNEGTIKAVEADKFGLPKVFIEWDKNHWSYNGAPDGWTFEDHFDIISTQKESKMAIDPSKKDQLRALLAELLSDDSASEAETPQIESPKGRDITEVVSESGSDKREKRIAEAQKMIENSESFVVIAVEKVQLDHPDIPEGGALVPRITRWDGNPVASLVGSVFMSDLASQQYKELVLDALDSIQE